MTQPKNLGGFGDGGTVLTNYETLNEKVKILRVNGSKPKYHHKIVGGNFRLDALQASILNIKLKYLDMWSQKRRQNANYYDKRFHEIGLIENDHIKPPKPIYKKIGTNNYHIYNQYTIRSKQRNKLQAFLKEMESARKSTILSNFISRNASKILDTKRTISPPPKKPPHLSSAFLAIQNSLLLKRTILLKKSMNFIINNS
jgi:dTDP-4-amino-4,6-dideoxygalactose transaminase